MKFLESGSYDHQEGAKFWNKRHSGAHLWEDLHLEGPKASGGSQKIYAGEMKDLCHQAEVSTLEPGSDAHGKDQSSPDESSSHSQQQQGPELLL
ncbi:hypothetical protein H920_11553 [Fukomys damarensis]|uniref:Uncharacterized protein n=1 Tax=Fukomys damarensis TaxID=885580 RepID=A0A091DW67_FUKDA|nr:hypothetical protein H920_11553 [Fukomys damarensis]